MSGLSELQRETKRLKRIADAFSLGLKVYVKVDRVGREML